MLHRSVCRMLAGALLLSWLAAGLLAEDQKVNRVKAHGPRDAAAGEVADAELVAAVDARLAEWRISADERPFDTVGWADDVLEALRLAKEHGRPVFLFTYSGRMGVGRC